MTATHAAPGPQAEERFVDLPAGRFRYLEWPGSGPPLLLLHGLAMVAEAWEPLIRELGDTGRRIIAPDLRAHGQSHPAGRRYDIDAYVDDTLAFVDVLELSRPVLAGHSMGARIAMVLAARNPGALAGVVMVDIGPEAWKANWEEAVDGFMSMPRAFQGEQEAIAYASRGRELSPDARRVFLARLGPAPDGALIWRADVDALCAAVRSQRSRNYWREWERIEPPALLMRGERSRELRPHVYEAMQRRNSRPGFVEIPGVGHNIPLSAPDALASHLVRFLERLEEG